MQWVMWLVSGGWAKNYRTQVLGIVTALSAIIAGIGQWATGEYGLADLLRIIGEQWPAIVAGFGLWFVGDKMNKVADEPQVVVQKKDIE